MSDVRFGKNVKTRGKSFKERYRLTEEEALQALDELNNDVTLPVPVEPKFVSLTNVIDEEQRFGIMGHYSSGFKSLDKLTLGFDAGEYIVLGAGTNHGKTQLATYIAKTQAEAGIPTLYISRELSNTEMKNRFKHIGLTNFDNLIVPESNRLNPQQLLDLIKAFKATHDVAFVVVDHLHAFYRGDNLTEVLGMFSAGLRELAQDLKICIMALSQFNRQPFKDTDGPTNYHLKESGYIADDAYTILLGWKTKEGLHVKLSKTRRLDMSDLSSPMIVLNTNKGLLTEAPYRPNGMIAL